MAKAQFGLASKGRAQRKLPAWQAVEGNKVYQITALTISALGIPGGWPQAKVVRSSGACLESANCSAQVTTSLIDPFWNPVRKW